MKFTFGIVTSGDVEKLNTIIDSIESNNIPKDSYEILIIGNANIERDNTIVINFDESVKKGWITKKKNMITDNAKFDNIVYSHDYLVYEPGWYEGWLEFGEDYKSCMNPIINKDGSRYRDWCLWAHNGDKIIDEWIKQTRECLIPYDMTDMSKYMYFSGAYWVAKKDVMQEFRLDEALVWGEGEDVKWSKEIRDKYDFSINTNSKVRLLKQKDKAFEYTTESGIKWLKDYKNNI